MNVRKSDIARQLSRKIGASQGQATELVDLVFRLLRDTMETGEEVLIQGLGHFAIKDKAPWTGRDPQTGESIGIDGKRTVAFKVSKSLKDDIMSRYGHRLMDDGKEDLSQPPKKGTYKALNYFINNTNY